MPIIYNGKTIPTTGAIKYNNANILTVYYNNILVWKYTPPTQTLNASLTCSSHKVNYYSGDGLKGYACSGNTMESNMSRVSYYSTTMTGHTQSINFTGYTKVTFNLNLCGSVSFNIGGATGGVSVSNSSHKDATVTINISNIGTTNIYFTWSVSENDNNKVDRYNHCRINSIVLSA